MSEGCWYCHRYAQTPCRVTLPVGRDHPRWMEKREREERERGNQKGGYRQPFSSRISSFECRGFFPQTQIDSTTTTPSPNCLSLPLSSLSLFVVGPPSIVRPLLRLI